ncbi:class I SAM-dependent methyltransferase [Bradyrhizobium sp. 160]|uniref:class I SAM-dependent methyltransferase n=1 Tax=Bradyrhizobium sp. 160 TaxID=2782634 RepID=UPI001FF94EEA|nr:class I SAM-dependent methyltransferase [Bradyrhizobium sp. 160]MCK1625452.1 class I SAM-dependent methyltransferase [Bradyrhizobium sp. 160]
MQMKSAAEFYDEAYFTRRPHGRVRGEANLFKFAEFVSPGSNVIDFGCGGGFLLNALTAADKIGIEINPTAVASARALGIEKIYSDISAVESNWADVIVSNHAMEHVEEPTRIIREFFRVLKPGGKIVIVTPYDSVSKRFSEVDPDFHLFSWNPATIGNLAKACGFRVIQAREIVHRWPPKWNVIWDKLGVRAFHTLCKLYGWMRRSGTQVRLVAEKPIA